VAVSSPKGHNSTSSISAWSLDRAPVRASTFLRAQAGTSVVKVTYALRLREREGQETEPKNSMTSPCGATSRSRTPCERQRRSLSPRPPYFNKIQ